MGSFENILSRIHRVFNRDPKRIAALVLSRWAVSPSPNMLTAHRFASFETFAVGAVPNGDGSPNFVVTDDRSFDGVVSLREVHAETWPITKKYLHPTDVTGTKGWLPLTKGSKYIISGYVCTTSQEPVDVTLGYATTENSGWKKIGRPAYSVSATSSIKASDGWVRISAVSPVVAIGAIYAIPHVGSTLPGTYYWDGLMIEKHVGTDAPSPFSVGGTDVYNEPIPSRVTVRDAKLYATGGVFVDLADITIDALAQQLEALDFLVSVENGTGSLLARGLIDETDGDAYAGLTLSVPESIFYNEMRTYGWELDEQKKNIRDAERQMYMHSAEDDWLDYWCRDHFGISRLAGEADSSYLQRVVNDLARENQNNVALELIAKNALGVDITIHDAYPLRAELPPEYQDVAAGRFLLETGIPGDMTTEQAETLLETIRNVVRKHKAAGTDFIETALRKQLQPNEPLSATEAMALNITATMADAFADGPIIYGSSWTYGTPGLVYGNNDAIKEQAVVTVRLAADNSITVQQILGE